jgi:P2X purinoceptor 4
LDLDQCPPHIVDVKCNYLEEDTLPRSRGGILSAVRNFTVLIKNQIGFPKFSVGRTNILDTQNASYLAECVYNAVADPLCPVFRIGDMADAVGANWTELALFGGVIRSVILLVCNFIYRYIIVLCVKIC